MKRMGLVGAVRGRTVKTTQSDKSTPSPLDRPLCQESCRLDRIGTLGGVGRRQWLDTGSDIRIG